MEPTRRRGITLLAWLGAVAWITATAGCLGGPMILEGTVRLGSGAGYFHEVNLAAEPGIVIAYDWRTTGTSATLTFDAHTHEENGTVTTLASALGPGANGSVEAPETGVLSFYWLLESGDEAELHYRIDGDFDVVSVVGAPTV